MKKETAFCLITSAFLILDWYFELPILSACLDGFCFGQLAKTSIYSSFLSPEIYKIALWFYPLCCLLLPIKKVRLPAGLIIWTMMVAVRFSGANFLFVFHSFTTVIFMFLTWAEITGDYDEMSVWARRSLGLMYLNTGLVKVIHTKSTFLMWAMDPYYGSLSGFGDLPIASAFGILQVIYGLLLWFPTARFQKVLFIFICLSHLITALFMPLALPGTFMIFLNTFLVFWNSQKFNTVMGGRFEAREEGSS